MSQTFLEDIPEFLEIQRDSFLRILDKGLIQAFERINPIEPTSQCKYGLLFYPKELVLILPENTITDAFLQGKTYGCKIYVPAIIYDIENPSNSHQKPERNFNVIKNYRIVQNNKIIGSRVSEETLFGIQESGSNIPLLTFSNERRSKSSFFKGEKYCILSWECFLTMLLSSQGFSQTKTQPKENKISSFIGKISNRLGLEIILNQDSLLTKSNQLESQMENAAGEQNFDPTSLEAYKQRLKPTFYSLSKHKKDVLILNLKRAQKTKENYTPTENKKSVLKKTTILYNTLPKRIRQKSKLGFFEKPLWLRGRSNTSLIQEAVEQLKSLPSGFKFLRGKDKKIGSREWLLPFSKASFINLKTFADKKPKPLKTFYKEKLSSGFAGKPLSRKEWVCIGVLPLMTPRGHFIINGSHRIIISQMARAPGLYYQTGDKLQATIVPSKGAWLRISVKEDDYGEIKVWVRITPQRKMPYKLFIETYKHLELSKTVGRKIGSKFLNLALKKVNSKIKHLDKHYAIGVINGQINRTLLNPSSYSLGSLGRKRLNERLGIDDKKGYLTSKDISLIKDNLLRLLGAKSSDSSQDDIDHLENRRVRTCGELLQTEIETGMARLKKAIGKQLDEYSNPDSSLFNTFKGPALEKLKKKFLGNDFSPFNFREIENRKKIKDKLSLKNNRQKTNTHKNEKPNNLFWLKTLHGQNWESYLTNREQSLSFFKQKKSYQKNKNRYGKKYNALSQASLLRPFSGLQKQDFNSFYAGETQDKTRFFRFNSVSLTSSMAIEKDYKILSKSKKMGTTLAQARLYRKNLRLGKKKLFTKAKLEAQQKKSLLDTEKLILSPQKIIGTKAFAGALREFFGSNPLSQYMDQTNPLAEITHKRRLSSLGPGGVDRASAGIAIRGIHPSHYGRICPIETPEGKNAGLVNSMTMWARINKEGFLETPYFLVKGGSLMSHNNNLIPQWNFLPTKKESQQALKIISSDLKITQSAFLPSIDLPIRDGSERSFKREKRDLVHLCGISPMQNISVATSLIPFLEHDDATRALMGSNMQRQAVPLLKAKEPLVRTGLEGKVVGESGHALQASCSGIISTATRTFISIDSFVSEKKLNSVGLSSPFRGHDTGKSTKGLPLAKKKRDQQGQHLFANHRTNISTLKHQRKAQPSLGSSRTSSFYSPFNLSGRINKQNSQENQKFIGNSKKLPFLKDILLQNWQSNPSLENCFIPLLAPQCSYLWPSTLLSSSSKKIKEKVFLHNIRTSFLFYSLNPSFRGLFKSWLNALWHSVLFDDPLNKRGDYRNLKIASTIANNTILLKPLALNCWKTFINALDLTLAENKEKESYKTHKKEKEAKSLFFSYGLSYKEKIQGFDFLDHERNNKLKQKEFAGNYFSNKNSILKFDRKINGVLPCLQNMTYGAMQQPVQVKNAINSEKYPLLEGILFSDCKYDLSDKNQGFFLTQTKNLLESKEQSSKTLWRENFKIKRNRQIHDLQQYTRSNQGTVCVQRPAVPEGRWVQKGDLIGDCSASKNGILALGQNIVVAYLPMEGFNFEDAIVVSDRLVHEELYTSIHVERVEFDLDALVKKHIPRKIKPKKQKSAHKTNGEDWITFHNPHLLESEKLNLNPLGIINVGSWVGPGDVLVSKVFPVERKVAPSRHLLAAVFQEKTSKIIDTEDTSLRVPKGIHGRVINVKIIGTGRTASLSLLQSCEALSLTQKKGQPGYFSLLCESNSKARILTTSSKNGANQKYSSKTTPQTGFEEVNNKSDGVQTSLAPKSPTMPEKRVSLPQPQHFIPNKELRTPFFSLETEARKIRITGSESRKRKANIEVTQTKVPKKYLFSKNRFQSFAQTKTKLFVNLTAKEQATMIGSLGLPFKTINNLKGLNAKSSPSLVLRVLSNPGLLNPLPLKFKVNSNSSLITSSHSDSFLAQSSVLGRTFTAFIGEGAKLEEKVEEKKPSKVAARKSKNEQAEATKKNSSELKKKIIFQNSINTQDYKITGLRIYIAERKKLQVGDKMSGRHGNKGIVSTILPREDMPYLPDGTPVDMVLNPLGIPSRMNVGQVFECLLGLAASVCGESISHTPFDEMYGPEASRSLVYLFLYVSRLRSHLDWIFQPSFPGKTLLFDGRTGTPFEQWITVGRAYMLKLVHMVDEKIHARSIGPRSLVTQQPVKGRARGGGQRLGEMEIWAFEGFGAAYTLQEILTIKSDDIKGREEVESSIISATSLSCHIPETFRITLFELRCLCLNLELNQNF